MDYVRQHIGIISIIFLGLPPLISLFHPGLPITHDGQDHVARIANFYASLSEGNLIPRWAGNLNWGYGHPILMFLYPLPSYLTSFVHAVGFSFVDSLKIVFGVTFVLSGITMFLWMRNILGDKAGIIAGVLYMYAPYRFVDLYVRGAIGEHVAFLFVPLVMYFFLKLSDAKNPLNIYGLGISLSIAGLLLSHNALSIMFLPIIFLYALHLVWTSKKKKQLITHYLLFTILGFGLSSFFILPAYFEGKYTLRDIVTGHGEYKNGFVKIQDFFISSWNFGGSSDLSKQIGIAHVSAIILSFLGLKKIAKLKKLLLFLLFIFSLMFSMALMLRASDSVWQAVSLLQKFQFPWRLLSVVTLSSAVLSSFSIFLFKKKLLIVYVFILCVSSVVLYFPYFQAKGYLVKPESFYTGVYLGTTDTGESSPIWSVRFMEHTASAPAEFIEGNGSIKEIFRNSTRHDYKITIPEGNTRIRENTLYFPNWEVFVNGKKETIEFQDRLNRGLITFRVPSGENIVSIVFKNTKLRKISDLVSIFSGIALFGLCSYLFTAFLKKKNEK